MVVIRQIVSNRTGVVGQPSAPLCYSRKTVKGVEVQQNCVEFFFKLHIDTSLVLKGPPCRNKDDLT